MTVEFCKSLVLENALLVGDSFPPLVVSDWAMGFVHHVPSCDPETVFPSEDLLVRSVAFSCDDRWLASASGDKTIKVWDRATGTCQRTLKMDTVLEKLGFDPLLAYISLIFV